MNVNSMYDKVVSYVMQYGLAFVYAILIFIIGRWVARLISKIAGQVMEKTKFNETLASFLKNIIYYVLLIFVCIAALNKIGVETTSFVALIGAAGLAVGLALQGSLANFAAGVMLILFQPFQVGDEVEMAGAIGIVKEIQLFNTVLKTSDKKTIIIPNAKITADKVVIHKE
jgi:small conductance mechanosensitive channel